jgi:hypothetical protein
MKNKYFFAKFWQLTMVLTILTQFLVIFISKTRGLVGGPENTSRTTFVLDISADQNIIFLKNQN